MFLKLEAQIPGRVKKKEEEIEQKAGNPVEYKKLILCIYCQ